MGRRVSGPVRIVSEAACRDKGESRAVVAG